MTTIHWPTWKVRGYPTPAETLFICDGCGDAIWGQNSPLASHCSNCTGRKGGYLRMRKATQKETEEARRHLKEIIN